MVLMLPIGIELADATDNQSYNSGTAEPPSGGHTEGEAGCNQENRTYCIKNDGKCLHSFLN